ncbi:MAG: SPOR domain-containing protein [Methylococcaceae bacterium]|nr:SPOR domain-containing protein [Methylococcaceae bacterium]MDP3904503.1 SPOR domain-containing protein [Methylococcaceae bacterium]
MDHELKQRLIGAVVVTALAAIFVPMLFDDPVDNSAQLVAEQAIPLPASSAGDTAAKVPNSAEQVLASPESPASAEDNAVLSDEIDDSQVKPANSDDALYAETPGYSDEGAEAIVDEPKTERPKSAKGKLTAPTTNAAVPAAAIPDQAAKKAPKAKVTPNAAEQELLKKVQSAKLQQDIAAETKTAVPAKKTDTAPVAKEVTAQSNQAKAIAAAVNEAKKPEVAAKPAAPVRWYIQVGSFSKKENATSLWEGLRAQGLPASLDAVQTTKGTTYRLRVGPELDAKKAAAMKAKLDKQNISSILVSE